MPFNFNTNSITPLKGGTGGNSSGSSGARNYNDLLGKPSINGITLEGNKTLDELGIQVADNIITEEFINSSIENHNSSSQTHIDIREDIVDLLQSVGKKANKVEITDNKLLGSIAIIGSGGQYEISDKKIDDFVDDIDTLNQQIGTFVSTAKDAVLKSQDNELTGLNTFKNNVTFNNSKIDLTNNTVLRDGINGKNILNLLTINNNTQQLYLGNDEIWIKAPDKLLLESSSIKTKRTKTDGTWEEYINIDSGNINNYITNTGTSTTVLNDKNGIRADYATQFGILDCPNGLINYSPNNKEVEIQPNVVLQMAGADTKTMIASKTKYEIEETGNVTLFFTKTESQSGTTQLGFIEAGDVFYQEDEPSNGTTSFLAWWQPSKKLWQFKSNYTGNVWRTAIATPIANINAGNTGIISINYIGYRILDDDIFAQLSDIDSINDTISTINTNINDLQVALDSTINTDYLNSTEIEDLETVDKTIIGSLNELEIKKADVNQLPQLTQLMNGTAPSIPDFDTDITDIKTVIVLFNVFLTQLRNRGVIS